MNELNENNFKRDRKRENCWNQKRKEDREKERGKVSLNGKNKRMEHLILDNKKASQRKKGRKRNREQKKIRERNAQF